MIESVYIGLNHIPNNGVVTNFSLKEEAKIKIVLEKEIHPDFFTKETVQLSGNLDFEPSFIDNKTILLGITTKLKELTSYKINIVEGKNDKGGDVVTSYSGTFVTALDSTDKFPRISDEELLTKVQKAAFNFFWEFRPYQSSGLVHEGSDHANVIATIGGSGFAIAAIPVAIERGFISRTQGLERLQKIVSFLSSETTDRFHGAFPHWINGETGKVYPFSTKDNGADLVETAFLMEGLIITRQYFDSNNIQETELRNAITLLYNTVEWDWFRRDGQNVLYWHWSPNWGWDMNHKIGGWDECLIVYVLAAGSPTHSIDLPVYTQGWAKNGGIKNGNKYYDIPLPLGSAYGGPLFFSHYSFIGLNPKGLHDQYANYWEQNRNHALINRQYCITNPKKYLGYSADCWGLTAGNIPGGYTASSPTNDVGTIT
ncbi:MAG: beta-glucosidase, partial [Prevotellaceae bacterium]|nr:beta-glucosidase [Prevotellaceae bacterium]